MLWKLTKKTVSNFTLKAAPVLHWHNILKMPVIVEKPTYSQTWAQRASDPELFTPKSKELEAAENEIAQLKSESAARAAEYKIRTEQNTALRSQVNALKDNLYTANRSLVNYIAGYNRLKARNERRK